MREYSFSVSQLLQKKSGLEREAKWFIFVYLNWEHIYFDLRTNFITLLSQILFSVNDEPKHLTIMCILQISDLDGERRQVLTTRCSDDGDDDELFL